MSSPARGERFDIADIIKAHRSELEKRYWLTPAQRRVLTDIAQCRTAALGGLIEQCTRCDYQQPVCHSCRNRHCPKCQALTQEQWIEEQRGRMLDMKHFHVVFTLPAELRPLAKFAPRVIYDALLRITGRTLLEFGQENLDGTLGATLVLHTWTRELDFHPHVHAIVTAGGLSKDGNHFHQRLGNYLFSVENLAKVFRAKILEQLWDAYRASKFANFRDFADPEGFARLINGLPKRWHVYVKASFGKGEHVLQYLGRYTHRVGLANSRLLDVQEDTVTFRTKGDGVVTLPSVEFLRRFVQHVLPPGFHKIRHIGLNASSTKRAQARRLLQLKSPPRPNTNWEARYYAVTGRNISECPQCRSPLIRRSIARTPSPRSLIRCRAPPSLPSAVARAS